MYQKMPSTFGIAVFLGIFNSAISVEFTNHVHKTQAAIEKINDLWCYECNTFGVGELCIDLTGNHSSLIKKCKSDEFTCMVKRFSYTTSTENSTSLAKVWSLERRCSMSCKPDCIVIGERTKLYACTSCCESSLCNTGKGTAATFSLRIQFVDVVAFVLAGYSTTAVMWSMIQ